MKPGTPMHVTYTLDDDLEAQDTRAIEVTLHLPDGTRRWCCFMTPAALAACGDQLDGTDIRIHYGSPHMIVVAGRLTEDTIARTLQQIDRAGEIERCSLPV